jgi:hypothetical protein
VVDNLSTGQLVRLDDLRDLTEFAEGDLAMGESPTRPSQGLIMFASHSTIGPATVRSYWHESV